MPSFEVTNFDAVAFDLEGTLADTLPTHHATRMAAFEKHGFGHITREQHELGPTYGSSHSDILGGVLHAAGEIDNSTPFHENRTVLDIIEAKGALFKQAAEAGFAEMPGAVTFVKRLAAYFPDKMSIVTSSEEEFIHPFLQRYDLEPFFPSELIIGHETVTGEGLEVKPSGDPYSLAIRRLNARRLLVFEDTVSGVAAGKKAGATVIAMAFDANNSHLLRGGELAYPPDMVADSYAEVAKILGLAD